MGSSATFVGHICAFTPFLRFRSGQGRIHVCGGFREGQDRKGNGRGRRERGQAHPPEECRH
jgi:hypothetical protein